MLAPGDLAHVSLPDHDRALLERLFGDRPPSARAPWARSGWFAEATEWIEASLAKVGRRTTEPAEQISTWCISSILRAPTAEGLVYFKATARSPLFVDEGAVTRGLARLFPENVPSPIAIDSERRWMLLDDFGPLVGWKAALETRIDVVSLYGRMQIDSSRKVEELIALGALDRRLEWLAGEIESLFEAPEPLGVEEPEIEQLRMLVPTFVGACTRLAAGPVPDALVHGDLHLSNVARADDGRYIFFDWTDACVTHPFLDMLVILFEDDPALRESLRDAYLSVWSDFATVDELLELWALAEPLASLNQAISYRSIAANIEPGTGQDLESMLPYWLRKAIVSAGGG